MCDRSLAYFGCVKFVVKRPVVGDKVDAIGRQNRRKKWIGRLRDRDADLRRDLASILKCTQD